MQNISISILWGSYIQNFLCHCKSTLLWGNYFQCFPFGFLEHPKLIHSTHLFFMAKYFRVLPFSQQKKGWSPCLGFPLVGNPFDLWLITTVTTFGQKVCSPNLASTSCQEKNKSKTQKREKKHSLSPFLLGLFVLFANIHCVFWHCQTLLT